MSDEHRLPDRDRATRLTHRPRGAALPRVTPPADLFDRILAEIRPEATVDAAATGGRIDAFVVPAASALAAVAAVVLIAVVALGGDDLGTPGRPGRDRRQERSRRHG